MVLMTGQTLFSVKKWTSEKSSLIVVRFEREKRGEIVGAQCAGFTTILKQIVT